MNTAPYRDPEQAAVGRRMDGLRGIFAVVPVSRQYPERGTSRLVRVYAEVRL